MLSFPDREPDFESWLRDAKTGDSEALGRILAHFRDELLRVAAQKLVGDLQAKSEPADLVQDTFIEAQIGFLRFLGLTEEAMFQWLRRILKHNIADLNRRFRSMKRDMANEQRLNTTRLHGLVDGEPTPRTNATNNEINGYVQVALNRLPAESQVVVSLRDMESLRFSEIAGRMNKPSADAVRKLYDRAIKMLQNLLDELESSSAG